MLCSRTTTCVYSRFLDLKVFEVTNAFLVTRSLKSRMRPRFPQMSDKQLYSSRTRETLLLHLVALLYYLLMYAFLCAA